MTNARFIGAGLVLFIAFISTAESKLYKWIDDNGVTHYGETLPPEFADKDNVQINDKGRIIKRNEKTSADEQRAKDEIAARKRIEDRAALLQRRKDNTLLSTFTNENEIDLARDRNLQQVDAIVNSIQLLQKSAQQSLESYQREKEERTKAGKNIPDSLLSDIAAAQEQVTKLEQDLANALEKSAAVKASYEADKARYRELTGSQK